MNKLLLTSLATLLLLPAFSQNVILKLFAEDAIGRKDTILFGVIDTSTLGIDPLLGEVNIFGIPFDSLDIRIIQRDSANFNCIRISFWNSDAPNLYFPQNIDSKIDFRPFGSFESVYNNFEIFIYAIDYPVTIRTDFSGIQNSWLQSYSTIHLLNNDCDAVDTRSIFYTPSSDSLFVLTDSSFNTLATNFQHEVGINEMNSPDFMTIYPNPVTEELHANITRLILHNPTLTVYDVFGQEVISKQILQEIFEINVTDLTTGIYFLEISDSKRGVRQKFIRQ